MEKKYIFCNSCFDKELLRKQTIILNDNKVDYKIINKATNAQYRAPQSVYFEAEVHVLDKDFERTERLLNAIEE
jgi:hypothetical protein